MITRDEINKKLVEAVKVDPKFGCALTGLVVGVTRQAIKALDELEQGYDRIEVVTTSGELVQMYVAPERSDSEQ